MERLVVRDSRVALWIALLVSLVFVTGIVLLPRRGTLTAFDWSGVVFFAAGAAVCIRRLVRPRPRLVIEQDGMTASGCGVGQICWTDVRRAYLRSFLGQPYLCVDVRHRETYVRRYSAVRRFVNWANQMLVPADFAVSLAGVDARLDEIVGLVMKSAHDSPGAEQGAAADAPRR